MPYDPAIPLLGIDPKKLKTGTQISTRTHIQESTIHNNQKEEIAQMSINMKGITKCGI